MAWYANFKMVWYVLLRPLRPELNGQDPFQICEAFVKLEKRQLRRPQMDRRKRSLVFSSNAILYTPGSKVSSNEFFVAPFLKWNPSSCIVIIAQFGNDARGQKRKLGPSGSCTLWCVKTMGNHSKTCYYYYYLYAVYYYY
jgi:hypothetical protein